MITLRATDQPLELQVLASEAGLHPELVRRLVRLGALDPTGGTRAAPRFTRDAPARLARVMRLRRDLALNLAGAILACGCWTESTYSSSGCAATSPTTTARGDRMDPNKLTQKTQEGLHDAQTKALRYGHTEVDVEHLLLALLDQPDGLAPRLLERAEVDVDALGRRSRAISRRARE